jgi:hypothetical protein
MAIIVSKKGASGTQILEKSAFGDENKLQEYIHDHPEAIPVYDIDSEKRLFVAAREFSTESGSIDALAVDKDGDIYIVETKLYANADKRRVVAQVLDYGASLWKHFGNFDKFLSALNHHAQGKWKCDFQPKVQEFFELADEESEKLLSAMQQNLDHGNLKFVVLMDFLDDRCKDLITYINQKSQFDIYGVELEHYKHDDYDIVIPKMYGIEAKKDVPVTTPIKWDEQSFLVKAEANLDPAQFAAIKAVYNFSKRIADKINWGRGMVGTFNPVVNRICPRSLFSVSTEGQLWIPFNWLDGSDTAELAREKFKQRLEPILNEQYPSDYSKHAYGYKVEEWCAKASDFQDAVKDVVGEPA